MTLTEISLGYQDSAEALRLRQCRELAQLTEHYYERSYCRDEHYRI